MPKVNIGDIKKKPKKPSENLLKDHALNGASKEKPRKKQGRPFKDPKEKLSQQVTCNFTESEIKKLDSKIPEGFDITRPQFIRSFLKKHGVI